MFTVIIKNEELLLLAEKGIYWPARQLLIVADVHWGKTNAFRKSYIHLPQGTTSNDLGRLTEMLNLTRARAILFLGDLFHSKTGKDGKTLKMIETWRHLNQNISITLVRGNHDLHAGDPPPHLDITCVDEPYHSGPFCFTHHPLTNAPSGYNICGHLHPSVKLEGPAKQSLHLPCFYFGEQGAVMPSFGFFTGSSLIAPKAHDQVFVVAGDQVIELNKTSTG